MVRLMHRPWPVLEWNWVRYLGKISYGIYLLHHFWVYAVFHLLHRFGVEAPYRPLGSIAVFAGVALATILTAMLSYRFFEQTFLVPRTRPGSPAVLR